MIFDKFELMKELKEKIENNLFKLDAMTDLLFTDEYEDSDRLRALIDNLFEETRMLQNKYDEACKNLDDVDRIASGL